MDPIHSHLFFGWELLVTFFTLYNTTAQFVLVAFSRSSRVLADPQFTKPPGSDGLEVLLAGLDFIGDAVFIIDIFLTFFVAQIIVVQGEERLIVRQSLLAKRYLGGMCKKREGSYRIPCNFPTLPSSCVPVAVWHQERQAPPAPPRAPQCFNLPHTLAVLDPKPSCNTIAARRSTHRPYRTPNSRNKLTMLSPFTRTKLSVECLVPNTFAHSSPRTLSSHL